MKEKINKMLEWLVPLLIMTMLIVFLWLFTGCTVTKPAHKQGENMSQYHKDLQRYYKTKNK